MSAASGGMAAERSVRPSPMRRVAAFLRGPGPFVAIAARVFASDRILTMRLGKRRG
jgi:hypothetical protein